MSEFKVGDKVRVLTDKTNTLKDDGTCFSEGDVGVVTEIVGDIVRVSNEQSSWISVEVLELVKEEKNVYTEKDIYEGMVLECVENNTSFWTVGKHYIVDKNLCVYDDDGDCHVDSDIASYLKDSTGYFHLKFKVVESNVKDTSGKFTGVQIKVPITSSVPLADNNMILDQEHYINNNIQPIEIMKANFTKEEYRGFLMGNIVKYPLRYKDKNGLEDLKKTHTYITWLIQDIEERGL